MCLRRRRPSAGYSRQCRLPRSQLVCGRHGLPASVAPGNLPQRNTRALGTLMRLSVRIFARSAPHWPVNVRLGQKQTYAAQNGISALPPEADMCGATKDVHFGPKADLTYSITSSAIDITLDGILRPSALAVLRL